MKLPYQQIQVNGNVIFTARGGKIHTFSLSTGAWLSSWRHEQAKQDSASGATSAGNADGPPAKRQKTEAAQAAQAAKDPEASSETALKSGELAQKDKKGSRNGPTGRKAVSRPPEQPLITHLRCTDDGSHVVAVTGHDKSIWVFAHDGEGSLTQLTQRYVHSMGKLDGFLTLL
jgi:tRNA (guanine-N(7)-)-methyltransferase subunit TRM82